MLSFCSSLFKKNMYPIYNHLNITFFQPQASESHNNRAGGQWEGLCSVNINKRESFRHHRDGKFHNKKRCILTESHNGEKCTRTLTWICCEDMDISPHFCYKLHRWMSDCNLISCNKTNTVQRVNRSGTKVLFFSFEHTALCMCMCVLTIERWISSLVSKCVGVCACVQGRKTGQKVHQ